MKIGIIGAGNMGGAIARALVKSKRMIDGNVIVSNPNPFKLALLKNECPSLSTTTGNQEAVDGVDIIIIAVKPWLVKDVLAGLRLNYDKQIIVSVAAGVSLNDLKEWTSPHAVLFRLVPNTAISQMQSMTLMAALNASDEQKKLLVELFNYMGIAMMIPERNIPAATSLTSCGIAYVLKYIQAGMQAGIEMGIYPDDAMRMVAQSVKGAAELILSGGTHPSTEIDKVTTPGGFTIKGINELDHAGFTSAIIKAMKASI